MADQMLVTCFTDLNDSTALNQQLGNRKYTLFIDDHLLVGKALANLSSGKHIKNIGDAHMVTFESAQDSLYFALRMQQYYADKPCLSRIPIGLRIGLYLGVVEPVEADAFGFGVNQAARTEGKAEAGQVIINKQLFETIIDIWGEERAKTYFISIGEHELKGITRPPRQELFSFDWQLYGHDNPLDGQSKLVFDHLYQGQVEASNIYSSDLSRPDIVIWPVAHRDTVNVIHMGQAEVIRLLVLLGWRVHLLIADCGAPNSYDKIDPIAFCDKLKKYTANRDIEQIETSYLSEYYKPGFPDYDRIQGIFRSIISDLTLQDFLNIVNKGYADNVKEDIRRRATLDCLRPILPLAAVFYLSKMTRQKSIIVAGADERHQWNRAYDIPNIRDQIGVLMIPVLNEDKDNHQMPLSKSGPIWSSERALFSAMSLSNTAWWTFHLHAFIPAFPAPFVEISGNTITPHEWRNEMEIHEKIQIDGLTKKVWRFLNPAS